jgi:hypothetical protein
MCDYSLHSVATRPAAVSDKIVSARFAYTATRGFAAVEDCNVAVCLRPGTELAFDRDVEIESVFGTSPARSLPHRVARFRQVDIDRPTVHHDALEFPDGFIVLVTNLAEGQRATVIQMPNVETGAKTPTERVRRAEPDFVPTTI